MTEMRAQAERFGTEILTGHVMSADVGHSPFVVKTEDDTYTTRALIIATGAAARWLGLPSELALAGRGVSTCATCDGFFFRNRPVAVVGGGDTALEEALYLAKLASSVTVIHRRDAFRASKIMQDKALAHPKISVMWNSVVEEVHDVASREVNRLIVRNVKTSETSELAVDGLFVAIGHTPNTALFAGQLEMDENGYLVTREGTATSVPGVFACGDVQDHVYRQAVTAAGTGCMAAMDAERWLQGLPADAAHSGAAVASSEQHA
jgi:thioredoxin reductase (NADPH)